MVCLVCSMAGKGFLCRGCRGSLIPVVPRRLPGGLLVSSGFLHAGPARVLVHRLKYQGIRQAAGLLAERMAEVMEGIDGTLIPVRRVPLRTWKYGVDPGRELAGAVAALTGLPLADTLRAPAWTRARAGVRRELRAEIRFRSGPVPGGPLVLVDDVLTTGATLRAARQVVGESAIYGVTATSAGRVVV